ncbi:MAG: DUF4142 domain-containing protein [Bacteroidota bacterium]|nr:DUF4142 domain-containing protein [Bacteroidota bacterium]
MKTKFVIGLIACGLMFNVACEPGAQNDDPVEKATERTEQTGYIDDQTAEILAETASLNMMNMELSRIAEERAITPEVKQFAQQTTEVHDGINKELQALSQKEPIVLPEQMSEDHVDKINNVADNEGIDFDKEYVDEIKNVYQDKIDEFENLARDTENPEVQEFALSTLPKLRMQLETAERVEKQLDNNNNNNNNRAGEGEFERGSEQQKERNDGSNI